MIKVKWNGKAITKWIPPHIVCVHQPTCNVNIIKLQPIKRILVNSPYLAGVWMAGHFCIQCIKTKLTINIQYIQTHTHAIYYVYFKSVSECARVGNLYCSAANIRELKICTDQSVFECLWQRSAVRSFPIKEKQRNRDGDSDSDTVCKI